MLVAWEAGADLIKVFPCGLVGGPKYIRTLKGPYPQIEFVPTGGVDLENVSEHFKAGASAVGVGEVILNAEALRQRRADVISSNARNFLEAVRSGKSSAYATSR